jgi:crotonobetainyl-CoA:carnitine CoA-transferase CaiB-like acyl-CoA transferase
MGASAHYLDQGKWSIALGVDLKSASRILLRLVARCDAVVVDHSAWLRHSTLLERSGKPVTIVSPFGLDGPLSGRPATSGTIFAMGGEASMLPGGLGFEMFPDAPPLLVRGQVADFDAGVISALVTSAAMFQALDGANGLPAEVSKLEVQTSLNRWLVTHYRLSEWVESRATRSYAYGGLVSCSDGFVMLQPTTDGHWHSLVSMLGSPSRLTAEAFNSQAGREMRGAEIQEEIVRWASSRTRSEVFAEGLALGIPVAPFRTAAEVSACEQYASRGYFIPYVPTDGVEVQVPGLPFSLHEGSHADNAAAPWRGRDTNIVLRELLGMSGADIQKLVRRGAVSRGDECLDNDKEQSRPGDTTI